MIQVDNIEVFNFEGAFRGLRNPMNSWDKGDTKERFDQDDSSIIHSIGIGPNDMKLAQRMIGGGPEEAKFLRQIFITMDIDAPIFWWKEMDTYKVGTTANSCSTMHKLTSEEISAQNFSFIKPEEFEDQYNQYFIKTMQEEIIQYCEILRKVYNKTKDKRIWRALIEILPEGWNQRRTWTANYQVLRNIYFQRRFHKLAEWREFCKVIEELPYGKELICYEKEKKE